MNVQSDILQYSYEFPLSYIVEKDQIVHTTLWFGTSARSCSYRCCSSYTLLPGTVHLPYLKSTASIHQRKPFLTLIGGRMKWQKPPQKRMRRKCNRPFSIFLPLFQVLKKCYILIIPISHLNSLMYISSNLMEKLSIGFGKIWNRSYINREKLGNISFEYHSTSEKRPRFQYENVFFFTY